MRALRDQLDLELRMKRKDALVARGWSEADAGDYLELYRLLKQQVPLSEREQQIVRGYEDKYGVPQGFKIFEETSAEAAAVVEDLSGSVNRSLRMDSGRVEAGAREYGVPRYIEQLRKAGLNPADAANYAALYMASLQGGAAWTAQDAERSASD